MIEKKVAILILIIVFVLSTYASYSYFSGGVVDKIITPLSNYKPPKSNGNGSVSNEILNEPKTEECPINGEMLTETQKEKWMTRRPLGIMIENHKEARPQSGLTSADVIYEAISEGGITRFLTIFYCKDALYVGPVRSARVYFMTMLREYGKYPLYAHVGGANCDSETGSGCANGAKADALGLVKKLGWGLYNDMNQFAVPFPYYWRDYERLPGVATEHTVYSSTSKLWQYAKDKRKLSNVGEDSIAWDKNFKKWEFKDDAKSSDRGITAKISFGFWDTFAFDFAVTWNYDKVTNTYKRENGGSPHLDKNNGKQISSKNVIIVFAKESPAYDGYEGGHMLYGLTGSGDGLLFQDGNVIKMTWNKKDEDTRMKFFDSDDKEISIVRGQVFVEILPIGNKVTY